jgi:hypothetical protein
MKKIINRVEKIDCEAIVRKNFGTIFGKIVFSAESQCYIDPDKRGASWRDSFG